MVNIKTKTNRSKISSMETLTLMSLTKSRLRKRRLIKSRTRSNRGSSKKYSSKEGLGRATNRVTSHSAASASPNTSLKFQSAPIAQKIPCLMR
jgi:hypothetical protein